MQNPINKGHTTNITEMCTFLWSMRNYIERSFNLLSAARAAATLGGKCIRLSVGVFSCSAATAESVENKDSTSFKVKTC